MADAALARFEAVDILVNNAAVGRRNRFGHDLDDWHSVLNIDQRQFYTARLFLPAMVAAVGGESSISPA